MQADVTEPHFTLKCFSWKLSLCSLFTNSSICCSVLQPSDDTAWTLHYLNNYTPYFQGLNFFLLENCADTRHLYIIYIFCNSRQKKNHKYIYILKLSLIFIYKLCKKYINIYTHGVTLCSNTFPVLKNVFNQLGEGLA